MRVALTIPYLPPYLFDPNAGKGIYGKVMVGGAETWGWEMAKALTRAGVEVTLFTADLPRLGPGWTSVEGLRVFRAPSTLLYETVPRFGPEYLEALGEAEYDLHHFSLFAHRDFADVVELARRQGKVTVFSHHGCGVISSDPEERRRIMLALGQVDAITVPSYSSYPHYPNGYLQTKIAVVPNGIDSARFRPERFLEHAPSREEFRRKYFGGTERPVVLYVGRLLPHKGLLFLLEAISFLRRELSVEKAPRLVLAGTGDQEAELRAACARFGLAQGEDVVFAGFVPDELLPAYFGAADVFTLPSTPKGYHGECFGEPEAFGLVLAEAMACGTACVGTRIPGVDTVIVPGVNGLLAEPASAKSLAAELRTLVDSPPLRERLAQQALFMVRRQFDVGVSAEQMIHLYDRLLALRARGGKASGALRGKIAFFSPSTNQFYSGVGKHLFEITRRLLEHYEIEIVTDDFKRENLEALFEFAELHAVKVTVLPGSPPDGSLEPSVKQLGAYVEALPESTVLCAIGWANDFMGRTLLEHQGRRPLAFVPHYQPTWTVPMDGETANRVEATLARLLREADLVFAVSNEERHLLSELFGARAVTGFNGVDARVFRPVPVKKEPVVLFVGDLHEPRKRFGVLLRLFEQLRGRFPEYRLEVVGKCEPDALERAIPWHLREHVQVRGRVPLLELPELYSRAKVLLSTSSYEAFCIPLVEAMACGTLAVACKSGGVPSVIEHGESGLLLDADNPDKGLEALWPLLNDEKQYERVVTNGRRRVSELFDWDKVARVYEQGFASLERKARPAEAAEGRGEREGLRVLVVNDFYAPQLVGGAEVYLKLLVDSLPKDVSVTVLRDGHEARDEEQQRCRVLHRPLGDAASLEGFDFEAFDVVHVNSVHRLAPALYERLPADRTIIDVHDYWPICPNNELVYLPDLPARFTRCAIHYDSTTSDVCIRCSGAAAVGKMNRRDRLLSRARVLLAHSSFVAQRLLARLPRREVRVIPLGIPEGAFRPQPLREEGAPFRILFIGRTSLTKGVTLFAELLSRLEGKIADFELLVVGNFLDAHEWYEAFEKEAQARGVRQRVRFLSHAAREDVPALFAAADVCIVPSLWDEPFGIIAIEALASGRPVVACRRGGLGQIFEHGTHSLYVEEGTAEAFANALLELYESRELRERLGKSGAQLVAERYTLARMTDSICSLYGELAAGRSSRARKVA